MSHPHMGVIIVFILAYKAGDAMLGAMVSAFWRDLGFSGTQFGVASITVGKLPAILGGFLGGVLTARWGISRALWLLGIFQALLHLGILAGGAARGPGITPSIWPPWGRAWPARWAPRPSWPS